MSNPEAVIYASQAEVQGVFQYACNTESDINAHLPVIRYYSDMCDHVTEFGVRNGVSLSAHLSSDCKEVVAYDINPYMGMRTEKLTFFQLDVLKSWINKTDFLFIDTLHEGSQLRQELKLHADKVRKYIGFHDTYTFGTKGESGGEGLIKPIEDFMINNPNWVMEYFATFCNGMIILRNTKNT